MTTFNSIDSHSIKGIMPFANPPTNVRSDISPRKGEIAAPTLDLDTVNSNLTQANATDIVKWAAQTFGNGLVMSSSFGI